MNRNALACIATVATVPALYVGASLAVKFSSMFLLPVPVVLCVIVAMYFIEE